MSADNYYRIFREVQKEDGCEFWYAVMGFASDDEDGRELKVTDRDRETGGFNSLDEALAFAWGEYTEYGVDIDASAVVKNPIALIDDIYGILLGTGTESDNADKVLTLIREYRKSRGMPA